MFTGIANETSVFLVRFGHRARWQDDDFVHVGGCNWCAFSRHGRDAIVATFDDGRVVVPDAIGSGAAAAIALVSVWATEMARVVIAAVPVERLYALEVVRLVFGIDLSGDAVEREERVAADLFHEHHEGLAERPSLLRSADCA